MQDKTFDWRPSLIVGFIVLGFLVTKLPEVLTGVLPGNDDMMRLQQVRDLMAGQAWYDVDQSRLLTPEGGAMHWSRLPDVFLAGLIAVMTPIFGSQTAEWLAVFLWPVLLLSVAMTALALIAKRLGASPVGVGLILFFFATGKSVYQFWPGRIDHHGLQVMLVLAAFAALLAPRGGWRAGAVAGAAIAAMVGVAMESLPYAAVLTGGAALLWILRGDEEAERLRGFGLAVAGMASLLFVFDAPGVSLARMACDAYGSFHAAGFVTGGLLLAALSSGRLAFGPWEADWARRLGPAVLAGAVTVGVAIAVSPGCLASPYGEVGDAAVATWLTRVGEARSIDILLRENPVMAVGDLGFVLAGLAATAYCLWRAPVGRRVDFVLLGLLLVAAMLVSLWQIRGTLFAHAFAAIPAGLVADRAFRAWRAEGGSPALVRFGAVALMLAPASWMSVAKATLSSPTAETNELKASFEIDGRGPADHCRDKDAYVEIAALPPARVFAPIDLGTTLLVRTPHSVFGAPYHRNSDGIARATGIFRSTPEEARRALDELEVKYVVSCAGLGELQNYHHDKPESLGAQLYTGHAPDWLEPLDPVEAGEPGVRIYRIEPRGADRTA